MPAGQGGRGAAMNQCIFCSLQHAGPQVVAANELAYAVLDIAPIRPGHTLVIPRQHTEDFFHLGEGVQAAMLSLANELARALAELCDPLRVGMLVTGFDVPHAHLHLVPIHDHFDITSKVYLEGRKAIAPEADLQTMRDQLRERLSSSSIA